MSASANDGGKRPGRPAGALGRREFLKLGGTLTFGGAVAVAVCRGFVRDASAEIELPEPDYEPLDGASLPPLTERERIIAALVDTVVPGPGTDPTGAPGALDACALNLIFDEFYPFADYVPALVTLLNANAHAEFRKTFLECTLEERTYVLRIVEEGLPLIRLAYRFIRSVFYGGSYNLVGANWVGWPGPNLGYREHEDFSFREPVGVELTPNGNLP